MAPSKKSKHKKSSHANSISPHKDGGTSKSGLGKRKISDMLGSQWSEEELERFYEAYRKYGKDWKKVATSVRTRAVEMVEALYTMNRAYLSLPEGTASVVGLIAMMTDHYCILGQSDSEQESNEGVATSRRPQKRARVKSTNPSKGLEGLSDRLQFKSSTSCMSLLKKRRTENVPRAVGKRTPRVPVSFSREKEDKVKYLSPLKRGLKLKGDVDDDDVAREVALALAEASKKGSPHISRTPNSRQKIHSPVKKREKMCTESVGTVAKFRGSELDEDGCEPSLGSTEADNDEYAGSRITRDVEVQQNGKKYLSRKFDVDESASLHMDDEKEACSGTEEGQNLGTSEVKFDSEVVDGKFSKATCKDSKRKSKKVVFGRDESTAFDALQTLADLSLMMPETATNTESSVQVKEEKAGTRDQPKLKRSSPAFGVKTGATKALKLRKFTNRSVNNTEVEGDSPNGSIVRKRRQKPSLVQTVKDEAPTGSHFAETPNIEGVDEVNKLVSRGKRSYNISQPNEGKVKLQESSCNAIAEAVDSVPSTAQVASTNQVNLPTKGRSRRKIETPNQLMKEDGKRSEDTMKGQSEVLISSLSKKALNLKEKLSHCITRGRARNWFIFEWFYSAIDYPWFAKHEFVEYLDHVGLGHVPRLTRVEWGVIRSSLGKPRRFSSQFLKEEKEKLGLYRDSVREYYAELHAGTREGLPTDLARPLKVGQRVIALHRGTREIHDGSVLTVDKSRYRVQFDNAELGVEFVEDIDCMPLNPLENIPASCTRQSVPFIHYVEDQNELTAHEQEREPHGCLKLSSCETLDNVSSLCISPSNYHVKSSSEQQKADIINLNSQVKDGIQEADNAPQTVNSQAFAQLQAREADVEALSELTRALDKKELVLSELKHMNDEAMESQRDGNCTLNDSESFKKQYAAVLFQLSEVNEQVSFAILRLRQRNTYQGNNNPYLCLRPFGGSGDLGGQISCFDDVAAHPPEYGAHVAEIVENSRTKAQKMVDTAMQTYLQNLENAIDFVNNQLLADCSSTQVAVQDQPPANGTKPNPHPRVLNDTQIPTELISRCVATLLMIQKCTERQFPPGDVAQVLDSAVASLQPCSSQNLPIYAEIQKCMGIIRNQILALVPT